MVFIKQLIVKIKINEIFSGLLSPSQSSNRGYDQIRDAFRNREDAEN
jgi:hypothetical protein